VSSGRPCPRHFSVRAWPWAIVFRGGPASQRAERSGARSDQSGDAGAVESPRVPPLNRFWILAGALAVTIGALALAFWLGSASFDVRRYGQHNGRLAKVMLERPSADRLTRGLAAEGTPLLSGYLLGEEHVQGYAAALDVKHGEGHVVLLGMRPQWRGQPFGSFKVLFNAALYSKAVADQAPENGAFWTAPEEPEAEPAEGTVRERR